MIGVSLMNLKCDLRFSLLFLREFGRRPSCSTSATLSFRRGFERMKIGKSFWYVYISLSKSPPWPRILMVRLTMKLDETANPLTDKTCERPSMTF